MGSDKAGLEVHGQTLLARVADRLRPHWERIFVVAATGQNLPPIPVEHIQVLRDEYADKGPLGGIYTGLKAASVEYCPVVACDMPFANPLLLIYMVDVAAQGRYEAVIPVVDGRLQYLHAVYGQSLIAPAEKALETGLNALHAFLDGRNVKVLPQEELVRFDPGLRFSFNINTPEDLEQAKRLLTP